MTTIEKRSYDRRRAAKRDGLKIVAINIVFLLVGVGFGFYLGVKECASFALGTLK